MSELRTRPDSSFAYGGSLFEAASALPLDGGLGHLRPFANLFVAALSRPRQARALILLLLQTQSEHVALSTSLTGQVLAEYFDERSLGMFPRNRLCRGLLVLPGRHSDYLRGRRRQALRTNLRRAESAGIWCEAISDPDHAFDEVQEIVKQRRLALTDADVPILASWRGLLARPEMALFVARDRVGRPLALAGTVIDDAVCVIRLAVASKHEARWALHDHLVKLLIARGVTYLLGEGGGPFGALGFSSNVHHYQRLLGYELRHVRPRRSDRAGVTPDPARHVDDVIVAPGDREPSPTHRRAGKRKARAAA
jgi:hypothetical protein